MATAADAQESEGPERAEGAEGGGQSTVKPKEKIPLWGGYIPSKDEAVLSGGAPPPAPPPPGAVRADGGGGQGGGDGGGGEGGGEADEELVFVHVVVLVGSDDGEEGGSEFHCKCLVNNYNKYNCFRNSKKS